MTAIVDRFEEEEAVLEVGDREVRVPVAWLPRGSAEGDVLGLAVRRTRDEVRVTLRRDPNRTLEAKGQARRLLRRLIRGPRG